MEIRTVDKDDERQEPFNYDKQQKNTAIVPRSTRNENKRYISMGDRTKRYHGEKKPVRES